MKNLIAICLFALGVQVAFAQQTNNTDTQAAPAAEKKACCAAGAKSGKACCAAGSAKAGAACMGKGMAEAGSASADSLPPTTMMVKKTAVAANQFQTAQFQVWGNCGMCKKTIETAAKSVTGVQTADWNVDTHQFTVSFDPAQASVEKVHQAIAAAGYDTELVRGDDKAYKKLHACCHYERKN